MLPPAAAEGGAPFIARLGRRIAAVNSTLCLGLDPDPAGLPDGFPASVEGIERFCHLVLDSAVEHAAAVKANLAFFEAFGSPGIAALERIRAAIPADVPFVADAKRGDIGSTAARQAVAIFDVLGADAMTASPYLGGEALEPLLGRDDRFVYVLCRTSNPGAGELQNLSVEGAGPLYLRVAAQAADWAHQRANVGLVVGATAPDEMAHIRSAAPQLPFLVPGVGAQGGDAAAVLRDGPARAGAAGSQACGALLVNVSRGSPARRAARLIQVLPWLPRPSIGQASSGARMRLCRSTSARSNYCSSWSWRCSSWAPASCLRLAARWARPSANFARRRATSKSQCEWSRQLRRRPRRDPSRRPLIHPIPTNRPRIVETAERSLERGADFRPAA